MGMTKKQYIDAYKMRENRKKAKIKAEKIQRLYDLADRIGVTIGTGVRK